MPSSPEAGRRPEARPADRGGAPRGPIGWLRFAHPAMTIGRRWFPRHPRWQRSKASGGVDRGIDGAEGRRDGDLRRGHHRRGTGRVRHRPLRRGRRSVGGRGRVGQGRRHLSAPGLRAGQGIPGDGGGLPHRGRLGAVRDRAVGSATGAIAPGGRLLGQPGPQATGGRPAVQGAGRADEGTGDQVFNGSGTLLADHRVRIAGNDGSTTEITGTDVVLAAGSVPRTIPGFDVDGTWS